jgi:8-oxo-dGTP pyrophosphatase MutT (NUDIX family)
MQDKSNPLDRALLAYQHSWPEESASVALFRELLMQTGAVFGRDCMPGHFTGSAWLVSADGDRVLLTHHRKLNRWLQLGGHADGDPDSAQVALREAQEESGLAGLRVEAALFDIDRHAIPARGNEPEHWHYDLRHVVRAQAGLETFVVSEESHALAWRPVTDLVDDVSIDASIRRMARKWLARAGRGAGQG